MRSKTARDAQNEPENDEDNMAWNDEWDDNDSTAGALESQHILNANVIDGTDDDNEIEDEIRANLSSKITSSLHAYKIAGIALLIALISFTINTVFDHYRVQIIDVVGICTICSGEITLGETLLYAVSFVVRETL